MLEKFHQHLKDKREGDIVTAADILAATGWNPVTLETHINKNAIAPFMTLLSPISAVHPVQAAKFRMHRDGASISKDDVTKAFTQIRPAALSLSPGVRIKGVDADYDLVAELGRGAVAQVWKCSRIRDHRDFAAKIVDPRADLLDPSTLNNVKHRFARELQNGQKLSHSHVVMYVDRGKYQEHDFLVMELADESLAARIIRAPLSVAEAIVVIGDCAAGIKHLHDEGCVHRDVKPHNILRLAGRYVLGDLGIVKWSDMNPAFTSAGTITKAAVQLGSWHYMAPEQRVAPHEATAASDIYALGISWYEMLTGQTLDPSFVAAKVFADPSSDDGTNGLIRQMVEFDQSKRPTAEDILKTLSTR